MTGICFQNTLIFGEKQKASRDSVLFKNDAALKSNSIYYALKTAYILRYYYI